MPLQSLISEPALRQVDRAAAGGNVKAREMVTYFRRPGRRPGRQRTLPPAKWCRDFKEEFLDAVERMNDLVAD